MKDKYKLYHILIIVIGAILIGLNIFHSNMWFDESYSVAIARHSFLDIWKIGGNDVHPILYYFCLHFLYLIFGNNLIVYRIFSWATIVLTGVFGYTHIRKDFGNKTGLLFSFLVLFLPVSSMYSGEIRMYCLGMLLGTIMAIYAYRIYINKIDKTSFIFFGISSLAVSYTHYYGLMFAGIVNLILFIKLIKERTTRANDLKKFIITAVIQVIVYIPWLIYFLKQLVGVSNGFWITLKFPDTLIEILTLQFIGNLPTNIALVLTLVFIGYLIFLYFKQTEEVKKLSKICIGIYLGIIIIALLISLCMQSVILLNRYLLILTGLIIFTISLLLSNVKNKYVLVSICTIIVATSVYTQFINIKENYSNNNGNCEKYILQNIQENDIILYSNAINGAVITTGISNESNINTSYFYNKDNWGVDEAYKSYSPYMKINNKLEDILDDYSGRIWLIEDGNTTSLLDEIKEKYNITQLNSEQFKQDYKKYSYTVELIEKN